ncbi:MAG: HNH endonuclease signature motif containing protein, partial [Herbiconiux sp.]|nr:HNH endonuclease signature motif containing protein [Herbiconiux sp.]
AIDDRLDRIARAARTAHPASATPTVHPAPAAQPSDPTSPSHTPPTHGQLRADALTSLLLAFPGTPRSARRASAAAIPTAAPGTCVPPPVISTAAPGTPTDDSPVDHALPGLAPLDLAALGVEHIVPTVILTVPVLSLLGHDDAPADLHGHGPIDLPTARRLAAKAPSFVRILTHPVSGETLTVERTRYRPTADQRLALQLDDVTCRFPGCGRRAPRCELDHTTDWAHGGATSRANLHHLCSKHHHLKHDRTGWTVTAHPGRLLEWTSPTGRTHTTVPAGRAHTTVPAGPTRAPSAPSPPTGSSLGFRPTPHGSRTRPRFREQPADADPG